MDVTKNNLDAVNARLVIKLEPADYTEKVDKAIKDYRKKVNMPGFRQGMAPLGLIKSKFGKAFLAEEIEKLVSESLYKYLYENKINIYGEPLPTEGANGNEFEEGNSFEFSFDLGLAPELNYTPSKDDKLFFHTISIAQDLIDQQSEMMRSRMGNYETAETSEADDVLKGDIVELDENGAEKEDGIKFEGAILSPKYIKDSEEQAKTVGVKIGDSFVINPRKAFDNNAEIASLLHKTSDEVKDFNADCKFTLTGITRYKKAELNQDFFDKAFGKDKVKSEEEFYNAIKDSLAAQFAEQSNIRFLWDVRDYVISKLADVEMPEAFLKRWVELKNKDSKENLQDLDKMFPKLLEDLKWETFTESIVSKAGLKVEPAEVEEAAKKIAKSQFESYGIYGADDDTLKAYSSEMLKNKETYNKISEEVLRDKILAYVKEQVSIENKEISLDEFNQFFRDKQNAAKE